MAVIEFLRKKYNLSYSKKIADELDIAKTSLFRYKLNIKARPARISRQKLIDYCAKLGLVLTHEYLINAK